MGKCYKTNVKVKLLLMRTQEQIDKIKKKQSGPVSFKNLLSEVDISNLLDYYFSNSDQVIKKSTGPTVLKISPDEAVLNRVLKKIENIVGNFDVRYAHFFDVTGPHIIHNDDTFEYPNCYKAFTIPLKIYGNSTDINLAVFDQYYYGGPAKFVNGEDTSGWNVHYNTFLTDYNSVEGINNKGIDAELQQKYLTHLRPSWLEGLSINAMLPWTIGNVLCFDSLALHCSTDFNAVGVERKIGLSVFTTHP